MRSFRLGLVSVLSSFLLSPGASAGVHGDHAGSWQPLEYCSSSMFKGVKLIVAQPTLAIYQPESTTWSAPTPLALATSDTKRLEALVRALPPQGFRSHAAVGHPQPGDPVNFIVDTLQVGTRQFVFVAGHASSPAVNQLSAFLQSLVQRIQKPA